MRKLLLLLPFLLPSVVCAQEPDQSTAKASATATASSADDDEREISVENDVYRFAFSYPSATARYEPLKAHFEAMLKREQGEVAKSGTNEKAETEAAGYNYHKHSLSIEWEIVADLPNWLSMSGEIWTYTGGAHGNYGFDNILYDKRAGKVRKSIDLFQSSAALDAVISERACALLDKERAERRGAPVDKSDEIFGGCPSLDTMTLLLGSSNGKTFDRMTLLAAPYAAGPFAEGDYEVDLDIDAAVLKTVKPEYAKDFTAAR